MVSGIGGSFGLVSGGGFSVVSRDALASYLVGTTSGVGKFVSGFGKNVGGGPGEVLRRFYGFGLPVFLAPFALWLLSLCYSLFVGEREVCSYGAFGYKYMCHSQGPQSWYSFTTALAHVFWVWFFLTFEGHGSLHCVSFRFASLVIAVGMLVYCVWAPVGTALVAVGVSLVSFSRVERVSRPLRWAMFVVSLVGTSFLVVLEVVVALYVDVGFGASVAEVVDLVPHPFLSLAVPAGSFVTLDNYNAGRSELDGLTPEERRICLVGDRLLKLLGADLISRRGDEVGNVAFVEGCQTDVAFGNWVKFRGLDVVGAKKVVCSFPEFLWGDVYHLWQVGYLTMKEIQAAFDVFHAELVKAQGN